MEPKTRGSRREVYLPSVVVAALRSHRVRQLEERLAAGSIWEDGDLVFTTAHGRPLIGTYVTRTFQEFLQDAEMRRMRFHDLRHACASLLLSQGAHPRAIMETLGHSRIDLTMNTYAHVLPAVRRETAALMDTALSSTAR